MNKPNAMRRARVSRYGVALLPFLLALVSCDNATGPRPKPVTSLRIVADDMGVQFQNLSITREGEAVTDATVTINDVAIPHTGAGLYQGQLPTAVAAGSPLNLQVNAGGSTVQGTVKVPEAPVLTAPPTGAVSVPRGSIHVRWTSATDPDRFVVSAAWVFGGAVFERTFPAVGSAREFWIGVLSPLPPAEAAITISVVAYNDGWFTGQADSDSRMSVRGEGPSNAVITTEPAPLLIWGDMEAQFQNLSITREGEAVTDATVTINGVAIPHTGAGIYQGELPTAVPAGSPLNLQVSAVGSTVQGTVNVPEAPVVTAPATGAVSVPRPSIHVSWTSATDPDRFVVSAAWASGGAVFERTFPAAGSARELEIASILPPFPAGPAITISVVAYNDGSFTGEADPASRMSIMAVGSPSPVIRME